jgi:hypothetical protein
MVQKARNKAVAISVFKSEIAANIRNEENVKRKKVSQLTLPVSQFCWSLSLGTVDSVVLALHAPHPEAVAELLPDFVGAGRSRHRPSERLISLHHLTEELDVLRGQHQDLLLGQFVRGQAGHYVAQLLEHRVQVLGALPLPVVGDRPRRLRLGRRPLHRHFFARLLLPLQRRARLENQILHILNFIS